MSVKQTDRVLAALRAAGTRGICQVDFLRYPAIDGGAPITRLAARVRDLKDAGHAIAHVGMRDKTAVYVLRGVSEGPGVDPVRGHAAVGGTAAPGPSEAPAPALFDVIGLSKPRGAYDDRLDDVA